VIVQQATNHAWINRGTQPCRILFVLMDSKEPWALGGGQSPVSTKRSRPPKLWWRNRRSLLKPSI